MFSAGARHRVLSKNPIDAVRRADSTLDARRVATCVTAESLCSARPVCRLFPRVLQFLVVAVAGWINQQPRDVLDSLQEENRVLREQLGPGWLRFTDAQRRRLAAQATSLGRRGLRDLHPLVTPETLLRWPRQLIARPYDGRGRRGPGRRRVMDTIRRLIVRMATENREWGDPRIRGALGNLRHQVARGPIANVRKERGREPAPDRKKRTTWRALLAAHWDVRAAADCFTVEGWTPCGLTRFTGLVLIHLARRRGQIAGISAEPDGPWVTQLMRNATDAEDGFLRHIRFLIHDRDPLFRPAGRDPLPPADGTPIRRPARSPNLNAYPERVVRTIKASCLERMVLIGAGSLRRAVREFVAHDHHERNHQGLDNRPILPLSTAPPPRGRVQCRQRLGGMFALRLSVSSVIHDRPSTPRSSFWTVRRHTSRLQIMPC